MKMKPEHFKELSSCMQAALQPTVMSQYKAKGLSMTRFAWDAFHHTDHYITEPSGDQRMFSSVLYDYLNDAHIETALKRIVRPTWDEI